MTKKKEVRKITAGHIFSWIFGVLFLLAGAGLIGQGSVFSGLVIVICSAMIIPYFNKMAADKWNFEISGGIKFVLIIIILIFVGVSSAGSSDIEIQPTENVVVSNGAQIENSVNEVEVPIVKKEIPKKQVKSATLILNRVYSNTANLQPIRMTIENTGDVQVSPEFDVTVKSEDGEIVCEGSPMFLFMNLSPGEKKTDEITIMCMITEDGVYEVYVDLLDSEYNKLDSKMSKIEVKYWNKFKF